MQGLFEFLYTLNCKEIDKMVFQPCFFINIPVQTETLSFLFMSESLKDLAQKYKANALRKLDEEIQHLRLLQRLLQGQAQKFLETHLRFQDEVGLIISQIKLQKTHILATNHSGKAFEERITCDLKDHLDKDFLEAFVEVVEKKIALLRGRSNKKFRGQLLVLAKNSSPPSFFRLDYCLIHERVEHPSLRQSVPQLFLLTYSLSTIKREIFAPDDVSAFVKDGFRILDLGPNYEKKPTVSTLIQKVAKAAELSRLKRKSFLYKDLEKVRLVYVQQQSSQKLFRSLKYIELALIHIQWEDDQGYFGTGFFFSEKLILTSIANVSKRSGHQVKSIRVCLSPKKIIEWVSVDVKSQVTTVEHLALIKLSQGLQSKKRPGLRFNDEAQLPKHIHEVYAYGFEFVRTQTESGLIEFRESIEAFPIKGEPSFDSYSEVENGPSIGSLLLYASNFQAVVFGVYDPLSDSVFKLDLLNSQISHRIFGQISKISQEQQVIIDIDERKQVPRQKLSQKPYSAIGMIYTRMKIYDEKGVFRYTSGGQGTGTFIAPNLILTCAHNVLGPYNSKDNNITNGTYVGYQIRFYPGFSSPQNYQSLSPIINSPKFFYYTIKSQDIYVFNKYREGQQPNADLAVLHLRDKTHSKYLELRSIPRNNRAFWDKTVLTICGYPGQTFGKLREDSAKGLVDDKQIIAIRGPQRKIAPDMLYYQIDTTGGNSGSAVTFNNQGNFEIVAVHTKGQFNNFTGAGVINYGPLLVDNNLDFVKEKLDTLGKKYKSADQSLQDYERMNFD